MSSGINLASVYYVYINFWQPPQSETVPSFSRRRLVSDAVPNAVRQPAAERIEGPLPPAASLTQRRGGKRGLSA